MKRKYNTYTVTVTDDYLVPGDDNCLEWKSEIDKDFKPDYTTKKGFKSFKEAKDYVYSLNTSESITIEDECCGEVYSSHNENYGCKCCGSEKWEKTESDSHHDTPQHDWQLPDKA